MGHRLLQLPLPHLTLFSDFPRVSWLAALGVGLAIGLPVGSAADPRDSEPPSRPAWARWLGPNAERPPKWVGENVFYKKGAGLEYRQETKFGESPIEIGLSGPVLRKKKDPSGFAEPGMRQRRMSGVGLTLEVRF